MPSPSSVVPQLFEMTVRSRTPLRCTAAMRFSGFPHRPKPPTMTVMPSFRSAIAASADSTSLFMSALHQHRHRLAAADAQRGDAAAIAAILHGVQQRHEDARARGTDGVAEAHRAAAHVHVPRVEADELVVRE